MQDSDRWETIFDALGDRVRRRVLVTILELPRSDDTVRVPEDIRGGEGDSAHFRANLYHHHLPVLEAAGYVRWDRDADRVAAGDSFDEVRPVLGLLHDNRERLPTGWV